MPEPVLGERVLSVLLSSCLYYVRQGLPQIRNEQYYRSDIVSHILALFGNIVYRDINGILRYLYDIWICLDVWLFSVLDNRLLSKIWVIVQKCQFGRAEKDIYFNQNTLRRFVTKRTMLCTGDYAFFVAKSSILNLRTCLGPKNIVFRVHIAIFAKYCVYIARTLQKYTR